MSVALEVEERRVLAKAAQTGLELGNRDLEHLANAAGIRNYQRMAGEVIRWLPEGRILDWGCGYGQMTYLLRNRGLDVLPFDVGPRKHVDAIAPFSELGIQYRSDPWRLPFEDRSFDAVLSCGVLEHIPYAGHSAREVARILRPHGLFLITMLPNRYSLIERVNSLLGISDHPVKYTPNSAAQLLHAAGFEVVACKHANMLPKNLIGLPPLAKKLYGHAAATVLDVDRVLSRVPILNWISGTLEIVARPRAGQ